MRTKLIILSIFCSLSSCKRQNSDVKAGYAQETSGSRKPVFLELLPVIDKDGDQAFCVYYRELKQNRNEALSKRKDDFQKLKEFNPIFRKIKEDKNSTKEDFEFLKRLYTYQSDIEHRSRFEFYQKHTNNIWSSTYSIKFDKIVSDVSKNFSVLTGSATLKAGDTFTTAKSKFTEDILKHTRLYITEKIKYMDKPLKVNSFPVIPANPSITDRVKDFIAKQFKREYETKGDITHSHVLPSHLIALLKPEFFESFGQHSKLNKIVNGFKELSGLNGLKDQAKKEVNEKVLNSYESEKTRCQALEDINIDKTLPLRKENLPKSDKFPSMIECQFLQSQRGSEMSFSPKTNYTLESVYSKPLSDLPSLLDQWKGKSIDKLTAMDYLGFFIPDYVKNLEEYSKSCSQFYIQTKEMPGVKPEDLKNLIMNPDSWEAMSINYSDVEKDNGKISYNTIHTQYRCDEFQVYNHDGQDVKADNIHYRINQNCQAFGTTVKHRYIIMPGYEDPNYSSVFYEQCIEGTPRSTNPHYSSIELLDSIQNANGLQLDSLMCEILY